MIPCKNKLSQFPRFSGCANNDVVIPILYAQGGRYYNYNLTFADLVCGLSLSGGTSIEHIFLSGNTLFLNQSNGVNFTVDLSSLIVTGSSSSCCEFTGNTSATCINDLYVHNLAGCSPINVLTDLNSIASISAMVFYGDGSQLTGLYYLTGATLSGQSLIFTSNNGNQQHIDISTLSNTIIEDQTFNNYVTAATAQAVVFTNHQPTYVTLGGIEAGTVFSAVSMQDMWTDLLYPNLIPAFTSFNIAGYAQSVDVGYEFPSGSTLFTWTITYPSFLQPNSVMIQDTTGNVTLASGLANDGSETISIPYAVKKTEPAVNYWTIYAKRNVGVVINRSFSVGWYWRKYWGNSTDPLLDVAGLSGLANNSLTNTCAGTYSFPGIYGYKYLVIPAITGGATYIRDASTNLNVALAGVADGYPNIIHGLPCRTVSISNIYGYATNYYVYRTKYQLGAALTFQVN